MLAAVVALSILSAASTIWAVMATVAARRWKARAEAAEYLATEDPYEKWIKRVNNRFEYLIARVGVGSPMVAILDLAKCMAGPEPTRTPTDG